MPFAVQSRKNGKTYFLHLRKQQIRNSAEPVRLYYFAGKPGEGAIDLLPEGYEVIENARTGLPLLRKTRAPQ